MLEPLPTVGCNDRISCLLVLWNMHWHESLRFLEAVNIFSVRPSRLDHTKTFEIGTLARKAIVDFISQFYVVASIGYIRNRVAI